MTAADLERELGNTLHFLAAAAISFGKHGDTQQSVKINAYITEAEALAHRYGAARALEVLHEAVVRMAGTPDWHKGHTGDSCPLVVEAALREALEKEVADEA